MLHHRHLAAAAAAPSTPPSSSTGLGLTTGQHSQAGHSPAPTYETLPESPTPSTAKDAPSYNKHSGAAAHADEKPAGRKGSSGQHSELTAGERAFEEKTHKAPKEVEKEEAQFQSDLEKEEAADVDMGPFAVKPKKLASLVDPCVAPASRLCCACWPPADLLPSLLLPSSKSIETLSSFGGIDGLLRGLGTDPKKGLDSSVLAASSGGNASDPTLASADARKKTYGANVLPIRPPKSLFYLMYLALKDKVLVRRPSFPLLPSHAAA